jgi:hypothetical protein
MENLHRDLAKIESGRVDFHETAKRRDTEPVFYSSEITSLIPITADGQMVCETQWNTFCGHVIDSAIFLGKEGLDDIEEKRTRLLSWLLRQPADGRQINLRYITNPDEGRLAIGIIAKCTGQDVEESRQKAYVMHQRPVAQSTPVSGYLPATPPLLPS